MLERPGLSGVWTVRPGQSFFLGKGKNMAFRISRITHKESFKPPETLEFDSHETFLQQFEHEAAPSKESMQLLSGAVYRPGKPRSKANVLFHSILVWDFDKAPVGFLEELEQKAIGYAHVLYTTFNHTPEKPKFRFILFLSEECPRTQFRPTRRAMEKIFGIEEEKDKAADAESTIFYGPGHPSGAEFVFYKSLGRTIDLEPPEPLLDYVSSNKENSLYDFVGDDTCEYSIAHRLSKLPNTEEHKRLIKFYKDLKNGVPYCAEGDRNKFQQSILSELVFNENIFRNATDIFILPEKNFIELATASITASTRDENPAKAIDEFKDQLRRARRDRNTKNHGSIPKEEVSSWDDWRQKVLDSRFQVQDVPSLTATWTEEYQKTLSSNFFGGGPIRHVVFYDNMYSVFTAKGFTNWQSGMGLIGFAKEHCIKEAGLDFTSIRNGRVQEASPQEFAQRYGYFPLVSTGSLLGQSRLNEDKSTFVQVKSPVLSFEPRDDEEIREYLKVLCASEEDYPRLLQWLSVFTDLSRPSNMLFLYGPSSTGKTMIEVALAGFWAVKSFTPADDFFTSFKDGIMDCPLVVIDDANIPEGMNSSNLRAAITSSFQSINIKGQRGRFRLDGHLRFVFSANDAESVNIKEVLNLASMKAVHDRILKIRVSSKAIDFLKARGDRVWTDEIISSGRFCSFISHLRETVSLDMSLSADSRFAATSAENAETRAMERRSNLHTDVVCDALNFLLSSVAKGDQYKPIFSKDFFFKEWRGKFGWFVSVNFLTHVPLLWEMVGKNSGTRLPSDKQVKNVLQMFTDLDDSVNVVHPISKNKSRFWSIDFNKFKDHLELTDRPIEPFINEMDELAAKQGCIIQWTPDFEGNMPESFRDGSGIQGSIVENPEEMN